MTMQAVQDDFFVSPLGSTDRCVARLSALQDGHMRVAVGARLRLVRLRFGASQTEFSAAFGLASAELLEAYEEGLTMVPADFLAQITARLNVNCHYLFCASDTMFLARAMSCAAVVLRLNDGYVPHLFVWDAGLMFQLVLEKPVGASDKIVSILPVDCIASLESSRYEDVDCIDQLCEMLANTQRVPRDLIWHYGDRHIVPEYLQGGAAHLDQDAMSEERRVWAHRRLWSYFLNHIGPVQIRKLLERTA